MDSQDQNFERVYIINKKNTDLILQFGLKLLGRQKYLEKPIIDQFKFFVFKDSTLKSAIETALNSDLRKLEASLLNLR